MPIDACQTHILSRSCHGARPLAQVRMSAGGTTRQAQGDCVADSDKAAGGPGRGPQRHPSGTHARVDPGARRRPWRLHGFPAYDGPMCNPREDCGQARLDTGAPDGVVSLSRCAPRVHAPCAWRMTSAPLPVRPGKRPRRAAPRRPSLAGLRAPAQPTLGAWRPGGLLPLGVMHGVGELVIAMPAIDIGTRLLRDAKGSHERAGILARRGGSVDGLSCGRHHAPLLSSWRTWGKGIDRTCVDGERTANVPQHTRDGLRVSEHGARSRSGRARLHTAPRLSACLTELTTRVHGVGLR